MSEIDVSGIEHAFRDPRTEVAAAGFAGAWFNRATDSSLKWSMSCGGRARFTECERRKRIAIEVR